MACPGVEPWMESEGLKHLELIKGYHIVGANFPKVRLKQVTFNQVVLWFFGDHSVLGIFIKVQ